MRESSFLRGARKLKGLRYLGMGWDGSGRHFEFQLAFSDICNVNGISLGQPRVDRPGNLLHSIIFKFDEFLSETN